MSGTAGDMLYHYEFKTIRVIDGDTIVVEVDLGFNIRMTEYARLAGVNTWEIRGANKAQGLLAKAFTTEWLARGPAVLRSDYYDPREKYGRVLATITRHGEVSLNEALLIEGHAT